MPVSCLVVDDHPLFLEAIRTSLERDFPEMQIAFSRSFPEAMQHLLGAQPVDLILFDFCLPGMQGQASVAEIVGAAPEAKLVIMSGSAGREEVSACIKAGAKGFLPKTLEPDTFALAVRLILKGATYMPAEFLDSSSPSPEPARATAVNLSGREWEVLELMVGGGSNKEIARNLNLQEVTVKLHANRIFQKLGVKNRSQAAVKAVQEKLLAR